MATKNFRSTVLEPTSEFAHGDKLRFTALATVGEVLKGSFSETTIGEDGVYSVDLQYGKHRIDYKPYEGVWRHFADVEVNADTLSTTLQDLALASVPVTDDAVLVLQGILADAEAAKTAAETAEAAAETALASIDATISDAESGYPDIVKSMFNPTVYVDNVNGDDANSGATSALAKKTLKSAIESNPSGSYIKILLVNNDVAYEITDNIQCLDKIILISTIGGIGSDESTFCEIVSKQDILSSSYAAFGFYLSSSATLRFFNCKVKTAVFSAEKTSYTDFSSALFKPVSAHKNPVVAFVNCKIELGNAPVIAIQTSGSFDGAIDSIYRSSEISMQSKTVIAGKSALYAQSEKSAYPFLVVTSSVTNNTGLDLLSLIDASLSMLQTNIAMTIKRNNVEYVNFDEVSAVDADIVADFDAALAEQQANDLFESEKSIALQIFADFNLGTGEHEITGSDISDVRAYIQSIDPAKGLKAGHLQRAKIPRPSIFDRYS